MWRSTVASLRRSAQELGTHAAMCFGTAGLDPALEGYTNEGLELLLASTTAVESPQFTRKGRPASLSPPPRPVEDDLDELNIDSVSLGVESNQQQATGKGVRVGPVADDGGGGSSGIDSYATGGGDKRVAVVEADAESIGSDLEVNIELTINFMSYIRVMPSGLGVRESMAFSKQVLLKVVSACYRMVYWGLSYDLSRGKNCHLIVQHIYIKSVPFTTACENYRSQYARGHCKLGGNMTATRTKSLSWKPCRPPCEQDEGGLVEQVAAEEDDMDGGLHDALALTQKWDGRGTFQGERASATSGRVEALLTKYQFEFDDESIDFGLIECLLRYICRSAYEDGAVLVFLPGWDDITRCGAKGRQS